MADGKRIIDGHSGIIGMDESIPCFNSNRGNVAFSVNRSFRGSKNLTRPGLSQLRISFNSDETRELFEHGAINGVFAYSGWRGVTSTSLMVAVGNALLRGEIQGDEIYFSPIASGLDEIPSMSWFEQVDDRLYWQNDIDPPRGWRGYGDTYLIEGADRMPRASVMKYVQGRLAICADKSYLILSDYTYGNGVASTGGAEVFIEYQYYNDLGAIGSFAEMGNIIGMTAIPAMDSVQGMGELLCLCQNGIWSFDPSGLRSDWMFGSRQKRVISGIGCPAPYGHVAVGQDIFFLSSQGTIESLQYIKSDTQAHWGRQSVSAEVSSLIGCTTEPFARYSSMAFHDNRVLASTDISVAKSKLGGWHHFGNGIISLDVSRGTRAVSSSGFSWDGLWTGVRPSHITTVNSSISSRLFITSHDDDGKNRIYCLNGKRHDEFNGKRKAIVSFYDTPFLFMDEPASSIPSSKTVSSVLLFSSGISSNASIGASARQFGSPEWRPVMRKRELSIKRPGKWEFPFYSKQGEISQGESMDKSECNSIVSGIGFQVRVMMEGDVSLERLTVVCDVGSEVRGSFCRDEGIRQSPADDTNKYEYKINHP